MLCGAMTTEIMFSVCVEKHLYVCCMYLEVVEDMQRYVC